MGTKHCTVTEVRLDKGTTSIYDKPHDIVNDRTRVNLDKVNSF